MNSIDFNPYYQQKDDIEDPLLKAMFADKVVPHYPGQILYKYMALETCKKVLEAGTIRFSIPTKFNDAFELDTENIDYHFTLDDVKDRLANSWKNHPLNNGGEMPVYDVDQIVIAYRQVIEEQKKLSLIFCTSVRETNEHLWKHYADKGRGICLGFYMPVYYEPWTMMTMHVQYTDTPKPFQFFHKDFNVRGSAMARWINTKYQKWENEEEVRSFIPNTDKQFVIPESGIIDIKFDPRQLKEIHFGKRMRPEYIKDIKKILRSKSYQLNKVGWVKF